MYTEALYAIEHDEDLFVTKRTVLIGCSEGDYTIPTGSELWPAQLQTSRN